MQRAEEITAEPEPIPCKNGNQGEGTWPPMKTKDRVNPTEKAMLELPFVAIYYDKLR